MKRTITISLIRFKMKKAKDKNMAKHEQRNNIQRKRPTKRISQDWLDKQSRKFEISSATFAVSTIIFFALLIISLISGSDIPFNIGIAIVLLIWFPSLGIAASSSKYWNLW